MWGRGQSNGSEYFHTSQAVLFHSSCQENKCHFTREMNQPMTRVCIHYKNHNDSNYSANIHMYTYIHFLCTIIHVCIGVLYYAWKYMYDMTLYAAIIMILC